MTKARAALACKRKALTMAVRLGKQDGGLRATMLAKTGWHAGLMKDLMWMKDLMRMKDMTWMKDEWIVGGPAWVVQGTGARMAA